MMILMTVTLVMTVLMIVTLVMITVIVMKVPTMIAHQAMIVEKQDQCKSAPCRQACFEHRTGGLLICDKA